MRQIWIGPVLLLLVTAAILGAFADKPGGEPDRLNEVTPRDALWTQAKGGLTHPQLQLQIVVPVRKISMSSPCLPVILWLKNAGPKDILLHMEKPILPWHGVISVINAQGNNIIEQRCHIAKHIPLSATLKPEEVRGFYINALDQGCGYRPAAGSLKPGKYTVGAPGSNQVTVDVVE